MSRSVIVLVVVVVVALVGAVAVLLTRDDGATSAVTTQNTATSTGLTSPPLEGGAPSGGYDAEVEANFIETCTDQAGARDVCQCAYDGFEREIPFDRFQEVDDRLRDDPGADLPDDFVQIYTECVVSGE